MKHLTCYIAILILFSFASTCFSFEKAIINDRHQQTRESTDGGISWKLFPKPVLSVNNQANFNHGKLYPSNMNAVIIKDGKRTTNDGGITWTNESESEKSFSDKNNNLSVYPNPLSGSNINIIVPEKLSGKSFDVRIYDIYDNRLFSYSFCGNQTNSGIIEIDLKDINNGVYLLKVCTNFGENVVSIIISR